MKLFFKFFHLSICLITILSCNSSKDYDGNTYKTITVDKQVWMAENLDVSHYRNGDIIPQIQDPLEWSKLSSGAWCYFENKEANGKTYGKLYNWFAVMDSRGLAPQGWHVPGDAEWKMLTDVIGGEFASGTKLKSKKGWKDNGNGTDDLGFNGLPGGFAGLTVYSFIRVRMPSGGAPLKVLLIKLFIVLLQTTAAGWRSL